MIKEVAIPISKSLYQAIYEELGENRRVFGTLTDMDGVMPESGGKRRIITSWGSKHADVPTILYEDSHGEEKFFLVVVKEI